MILLQFLHQYDLELIILLASLLFLLFCLSIFNLISLTKIKKKYKRLTRGIENKNMEALFIEHIDRLENSFKNMESIQSIVHQHQTQLQTCIQKVGFIRYNPFQEVGGDLSFSIAFLDAVDNGIVISGLYSRNGSSIFSKSIVDGNSPQLLSEEEKIAIQEAKK